MKNTVFTLKTLTLLLVVLCLFSCEDKMEEHYKVPGWLKGSAWEVLKSDGNYSIFLKGVELAGYRPMMEGKSILTVMAPDDSVFKTYLTANGYSDISDMSAEEINKVIGFHLLYYSYNKEKLINFRPEGDFVTDENKEINAGLYYKFRTRSANTTTTEIDYANGKHVTVYHLERFIPVFSYRFFDTKEIDAKYNYEYFYPNSTWAGQTGFNVSDASVKEYGIIADNGYIYTIDRVLQPLETIYTELKKRNDYSLFFNLYDSYSTFVYDNTLSKDYGPTLGVDSLFLHQHGDLPPIAMEWPVSSYLAISTLASVSYSLFAPSNNALNGFFERFWEKGDYESLDDIDPLIMKHLLNQFVSAGSIAFPEQIRSGKIKNSYGVPFNFDPADVTEKAMCVNGNFYGMDEMKNPPLFGSVIGPAFRNKNATGFLYALDGSSLLNSYVSSDVEYTMLIPKDSQMQANGISLNTYTTGTVLQYTGEDGLFYDMSSRMMQNLVNFHTSNTTGGIKNTGIQVCATQSTFNYWFVKDGKITSNALFNEMIIPGYTGTPFVDFEEITDEGTSWSNGKAYAYDYTDGLFENEATDGLERALAVCNDQRYPYNSFVQLMKKAGLVSGTSIPFLFNVRFIAFIPTNDAIKSALSTNRIPGIINGSIAADGSLVVSDANTDIATLRSYLASYFLRSSENVISTYPYPGSEMKSATYISANYRNLIYTDNGNTMSVQLEGATSPSFISSVYDRFPFAYSDGCFQLIDEIL